MTGLHVEKGISVSLCFVSVPAWDGISGVAGQHDMDYHARRSIALVAYLAYLA